MLIGPTALSRSLESLTDRLEIRRRKPGFNQIPDLSSRRPGSKPTARNYALDLHAVIGTPTSRPGGLDDLTRRNPPFGERLPNRVSPVITTRTPYWRAVDRVPQPASWTARCLGGRSPPTRRCRTGPRQRRTGDLFPTTVFGRDGLRTATSIKNLRGRHVRPPVRGSANTPGHYQMAVDFPDDRDARHSGRDGRDTSSMAVSGRRSARR